MFRAVTRVSRLRVLLGGGSRCMAAQRAAYSGATNLPHIDNEPCLDYEPGSDERDELKAALEKTRGEVVEIPVVIDGEEYHTGDLFEQCVPSDHQHKLANVHLANRELIEKAIKVSVERRKEWGLVPFEHRAAVFLKAADLLSTRYRSELMATCMLGQSKNVWQAEIDSAAETIDFLRFNVKYANDIYGQQPQHHAEHVWNRLVYRNLEGFVAAIAPFNFTAIGANLASAPATMGNTVLWKPSLTAALSNYYVFNVLREAGLPDGVINFLPSDGLPFGEAVTQSPDLAAINFTGSTNTFKWLWKAVGQNLDRYKTFPRLLGETGGKNFHLIHESADMENAVIATLRGAFEYQGQKCSATSRLYVPASVWPQFRDELIRQMEEIKMGQPDDFDSFMCAVIDRNSYDRISKVIEGAKARDSCTILSGGGCDDSRGYFVQPTLVETKDPTDPLMVNEIFGPVLTAYVYDDNDYDKVVELVDKTTEYGLTGSIFATDRVVIEETLDRLRDASGNTYINAKSTGAVVGQQPFGGARLSGTNDKAGNISYLYRFTSVQSVKECLSYVSEWRYPHQDEP